MRVVDAGNCLRRIQTWVTVPYPFGRPFDKLRAGFRAGSYRTMAAPNRVNHTRHNPSRHSHCG